VVERNDFRDAVRATAGGEPQATLIQLFICGRTEPAAMVAAALPLADCAPGERFDLVVSNPPFVAGPGEATHTYRDSGRPRDAVCAELARATPEMLSAGGTSCRIPYGRPAPDQRQIRILIKGPERVGGC
jgi:hypothetical protein